MANGNEYGIIRFNNAFVEANIADIGIAGAATAGTTLQTDGGGTIYEGYIAYNFTDDQYAMITAVGATLTLSRNAGFNSGDRYVIFRDAGVLYAWQNGANISLSVRSVRTGTSFLTSSITNAQNPYIVQDGTGNSLVVYEATGAPNRVQVRRVNAAGVTLGGWPVYAGTQTGANESIIQVISDGSGGVVVLYQYSNVMHAQRITNAGAVLWSGNGYNLGNIAAYDVSSVPNMVYNGTNDIIVAAQIGQNIWANYATGAGTPSYPWGVNGIDVSTATGNQRNPKIFTDWTNTKIVWEDDRFYSSAGYGIFGMQVDAGGAKSFIAWRANTSGANDWNGVSVILNSGNKYWPLGIQIVTYNNGADAALIWEDWRNVDAGAPYNGSDLLYIDIEAFTPY